MKKSTEKDTTKLLEQAWKKYNKKDFDGASSLFSDVNEEDDNYFEAAYGHAASMLRKKNYGAAIEILDKLTESEPNDFKLYHIRALCHGGDENFEGAIEDLEKAISIAGDRHDLYYDLGGTFLAARDYKRAAQCFEKCIDIDNKCYEAWVGKALSSYYNKEMKAAFEFANIALKFNPKSLIALLLKAEVLIETGKKNEVEKELKKIKTIDPDVFKTDTHREGTDHDDYEMDEDAYRTEDDEIEDFKLDD